MSGGEARTSVEVDGALLDEARRAAGLRTDAETVEEALRLLVRLREQQEVLDLAGKVRWEGDPGLSRAGRNTRLRTAARWGEGPGTPRAMAFAGDFVVPLKL